MVNIFFNYYISPDAVRVKQVGYCLQQIIKDEHIDTVYVCVHSDDADAMKELIDEEYDYKVNTVIYDDRPTFHYAIYRVLGENTLPDDINILLNSDCFLGPATDWDFILSMPHDVAMSLSRFDVFGVDPIVLDPDSGFPRIDSQDCWIFKGVPKEGMSIEFYFGRPGCDNRISYELSQKYNILGCVSKVQTIHYHRPDEYRCYNDSQRLDGPYVLVKLS